MEKFTELVSNNIYIIGFFIVVIIVAYVLRDILRNLK